jgi:hypothetical protein
MTLHLKLAHYDKEVSDSFLNENPGFLISVPSYFKPDVNKTTCFTKNSVGSWPKYINASHEIGPL